MNCPNCGAPLADAVGKSTVVCDHCGSVVALKASSPPASAAPDAPEERAAAEPRYEYGLVPDQRPVRSDLTSVALGPADAARVIQLLRDKQELQAIQYYQAKVGGSLGEAKEAIGAIQAGLRDTSAYIVPAVAGPERQLRQNRVGDPMPLGRPARTGTGRGGCAIGCLGIVALLMCLFGGCGAYIQTKAIYKCSMREIKAALAQQEIFAPPIDGGYILLIGGMNEHSGSGEWSFNANYYAPVWGSNGWAMVDAHIAADGTGWNRVSAQINKDGRTVQLLPAQKIDCEQ